MVGIGQGGSGGADVKVGEPVIGRLPDLLHKQTKSKCGWER